MKQHLALLALLILAGCHRGPKELTHFPAWLEGEWVAVLSDEYHTMVIRENMLGFASRTSVLPEPTAVAAIEQTAKYEVWVTPNYDGWKHRFTKSNDDSILAYDIRLEDGKELSRAKYRRIKDAQPEPPAYP